MKKRELEAENVLLRSQNSDLLSKVEDLTLELSDCRTLTLVLISGDTVEEISFNEEDSDRISKASIRSFVTKALIKAAEKVNVQHDHDLPSPISTTN